MKRRDLSDNRVNFEEGNDLQNLTSETSLETDNQRTFTLHRTSANYTTERAQESSSKRTATRQRACAAAEARRATESSEQRHLRLRRARANYAQKRATESSEQRRLRLQRQRAAAAARKANESPEHRHLRLQRARANYAQRRARQLPEQRNSSLQGQRAAYAARRAIESSQQRNTRLEQARRRQANRDLSNETRTNGETSESEIEEQTCGSLREVCDFCNALHFKVERPSDGKFTSCCQKWKVRLSPFPTFPNELKSLFCGNDHRSKNFMENVRSYNSAISFASFGAQTASPKGHGPYCFRLHGQIYHRVGTLHPLQEERPKYAQLYLLDPEEALKERMLNPENSKCDPSLMQDLDKWMRSWNDYAKIYMRLNEVERLAITEACANNKSVPTICMALRHDRQNDPRRYNSPVANEVAVIFVNQDGEPPLGRDILLHNKPDPNDPEKTKTKRLNILDPMVDPMAYPLLFPFGEDGWRVNLPHAVCTGKRNFVTQMQYYQYRFAIRQQYNPILNAGKLTQQYAVDSYVRMEGNRLNYIRQNQSQLRCELYQGLIDEMNSDAQRRGLLPGKPIILPSSFAGSPRNMFQSYQDAMSIVRKYGKPDIFLTMTCNPRWKEIVENLMHGQRPEFRPDLIARVFYLKLKSLVDDIMKKDIFGKVIAKIHVIEFQKRGLPHAHMLLILSQTSKIRTPENIDRIVCAEIPDSQTSPRLHRIVLKHMIHGPCGEFNPLCPCMADGSCSKQYPKTFESQTKENVNGYPRYRRRQVDEIFFVGNTKIDNRWVVPYNKYLCLKYDCHINVEICASIKSVKYLFKYVYKGHDRAFVEISEHDGIMEHDEIKTFLDTRYVSAPEAMWHIFAFEMHQQSHTIVRLPVHLENQQLVTFYPNQVASAVQNSRRAGTKLTAWFKLNQLDERARQYFYWQIPEFYIYERDNTLQRTEYHWRPRIIGQERVIGRMYAVNMADIERFCLRLLLLHVKGATSYEDVRTVNGELCSSFQEAAKKRGLLADDDVWHNTLVDAELADMPFALRQLFAFICVYGAVSDIKYLWERHKHKMMEDIVRRHVEHDADCWICEH